MLASSLKLGKALPQQNWSLNFSSAALAATGQQWARKQKAISLGLDSFIFMGIN